MNLSVASNNCCLECWPISSIRLFPGSLICIGRWMIRIFERTQQDYNLVNHLTSPNTQRLNQTSLIVKICPPATIFLSSNLRVTQVSSLKGAAVLTPLRSSKSLHSTSTAPFACFWETHISGPFFSSFSYTGNVTSEVALLKFRSLKTLQKKFLSNFFLHFQESLYLSVPSSSVWRLISYTDLTPHSVQTKRLMKSLFQLQRGKTDVEIKAKLTVN